MPSPCSPSTRRRDSSSRSSSCLAWSPGGSRSLVAASRSGCPRPRPGRAADRRDVPRRGAAAVLRGHDPRPRRADPVARSRLRRGTGAARVAVRARGARPAGAAGRRVPERRSRRHWTGSQPSRGCRAGRRAARPDRGAALAELLPGRRLPDVPAQVQVRPRPAGAAGAAPRSSTARRSTRPSSSSITATPAGR